MNVARDYDCYVFPRRTLMDGRRFLVARRDNEFITKSRRVPFLFTHNTEIEQISSSQPKMTCLVISRANRRCDAKKICIRVEPLSADFSVGGDQRVAGSFRSCLLGHVCKRISHLQGLSRLAKHLPCWPITSRQIKWASNSWENKSETFPTRNLVGRLYSPHLLGAPILFAYIGVVLFACRRPLSLLSQCLVSSYTRPSVK